MADKKTKEKKDRGDLWRTLMSSSGRRWAEVMMIIVIKNHLKTQKEAKDVILDFSFLSLPSILETLKSVM